MQNLLCRLAGEQAVEVVEGEEVFVLGFASPGDEDEQMRLGRVAVDGGAAD